MKYFVDVGNADACTALGVCRVCVNVRFLAGDYEAAMVRLAEHEASAHPRTFHVRSNLARFRARHARV